MSGNRFSEIYEKNEWLHGSGEGSLELHTRGYRKFLEEFVRRNHVSSIVDMGCGDWQSSRFINWGDAKYQGYDVVPAVIDSNRDRFAATTVSFTLYSGRPSELPPADLLIAKDILQHLPDRTIFELLPHLSRYRYALITNDVDPAKLTVNADIAAGEHRYLDLRLPPFNLDAREVFSFEKATLIERLKRIVRGYPAWRKVVLLVDNSTR